MYIIILPSQVTNGRLKSFKKFLEQVRQITINFKDVKNVKNLVLNIFLFLFALEKTKKGKSQTFLVQMMFNILQNTYNGKKEIPPSSEAIRARMLNCTN